MKLKNIGNLILETVQITMFVIVYCPPGPYSEFLCEFHSLTVLKINFKVIIVGDFNIPVDIEIDRLGSELISLLD